MKPVTLWPFLYLSARWCIFTLANYFVDTLTTRGGPFRSRSVCSAHNKPENEVETRGDCTKRFTYVKALFYTKKLHDQLD